MSCACQQRGLWRVWRIWVRDGQQRWWGHLRRPLCLSEGSGVCVSCFSLQLNADSAILGDSCHASVSALNKQATKDLNTGLWIEFRAESFEMQCLFGSFLWMAVKHSNLLCRKLLSNLQELQFLVQKISFKLTWLAGRRSAQGLFVNALNFCLSTGKHEKLIESKLTQCGFLSKWDPHIRRGADINVAHQFQKCYI